MSPRLRSAQFRCGGYERLRTPLAALRRISTNRTRMRTPKRRPKATDRLAGCNRFAQMHGLCRLQRIGDGLVAQSACGRSLRRAVTRRAKHAPGPRVRKARRRTGLCPSKSGQVFTPLAHISSQPPTFPTTRTSPSQTSAQLPIQTKLRAATRTHRGDSFSIVSVPWFWEWVLRITLGTE